MPSPLTLPLTYGRQKPPLGAPVRRGHPLGAKLTACYLLNEGAGTTAFDARSGTPGSFGTGTGGVTGVFWDVSPFGPAVRTNDSGTGTVNSAVVTVPKGGPRQQTWSIAAHIFVPSATQWAFVGSSGIGGIELRTTTGNTIQLLAQAVNQMGTSSGTIALGTWQHVAVTRQAGGAFRFYVEGKDAGGGTSAQTFTYADFQFVRGQQDPGASGTKTAYIQVFDGSALSAAEVAQLWAAPFCMF